MIHKKSDFSLHPGRKGVCVNAQCVQEKEQLERDLEKAKQELQEQKEHHERLYRLKNEECAKFAQAVVSFILLVTDGLSVLTNIVTSYHRNIVTS